MSRKAGDPYRPCNGSEAAAFHEFWCSNCARDKVMNGEADPGAMDDANYCEILSRSFREEPLPEWVWGADGLPRCLKFVRVGEPVVDRCERTADMFAEGGGQ